MSAQKPYNKPDLHKPRVRRTVKKILNIKFYRRFYKQHKALNLTKKDIRNIIFTFHGLCTDSIANTRDGIELPEQLGYIFLGSCKKKEKPVDEKKSMEYNIQLNQLNWDSNGWLCKVSYTNFASKYRFKNAHLWAFQSSKVLKTKVSHAYRKDYKKYVIIDNFKKLNHIFRLAKMKLKDILKNNKDNI